MVGAGSTSHQLVLVQGKVDTKSNEITAIPALLEMLSIEGSIITIVDAHHKASRRVAMGCQKEIASVIIKKKADYILALKANQKNIYLEVKNWFELANKEEFLGREYDYYEDLWCASSLREEIESGHNRIEKRKIWTVPIVSLTFLQNQSLWTGLTTIVMVVSERKMWNKTTNEVRFYLSSLGSNAEKIAKAILYPSGTTRSFAT